MYEVGAGMEGKPLAHGGTVIGTEDAIKAEMIAAWEAMYDDAKYAVFKENMRKVKGIIDGSCTRGEASRNLKQLVDTYLR